MIFNTSLFTDHYEFTMAQGYYLAGMHKTRACFDYFFRKNPFGGAYTVFAGLQDLLDALERFRFGKEERAYLLEIGFNTEFVRYLENLNLCFDIFSVREGEIVFPREPVMRIEGNLPEVQILETIVLNLLNFESLIATKAARMKYAAGDRGLMDFGLRRAQGAGGIQASRAAIIGGFDKTSNVLGARLSGLESTGTMAHSWIQSFEDELSAFRVFAGLFPDQCILLVDTYDTMKSGLPNAIKVAREMEEKGQKLGGIRLDSGDLSWLSKRARKMLDEAGLDYVKIIASGQLDEYIIQSLIEQHSAIDLFGVGTALVTGKDEGALDGVYKLSMVGNRPVMKFSDNAEKMTLPGVKDLYRYKDSEDRFQADGICLMDEPDFGTIYHPVHDWKNMKTVGYLREHIHHRITREGRTLIESENPYRLSEYFRERFRMLPGEYKRFVNPHEYKTGISGQLLHLRDELSKQKYNNH